MHHTQHKAGFKQVEWSEQFRLVTSHQLGAVCHRVQIWLCFELYIGVKEILFGYIYCYKASLIIF